MIIRDLGAVKSSRRPRYASPGECSRIGISGVSPWVEP
jgi:hypothetical protein